MDSRRCILQSQKRGRPAALSNSLRALCLVVGGGRCIFALLRTLHLDGCTLLGSLPAEIGLTSLQILHVSSPKLLASLPPKVAAALEGAIEMWS